MTWYKSIWCALLALVAATAGQSAGPPPSKALGGYQHRSWSAVDGAPSSLIRLAQDQKGYLWISSRSGLYRFDGLRFEQIPADVPDGASQAAIPLLVTRSGAVWSWFADANRFGVYRNGTMRLLPDSPNKGTVIDLAEGIDGAIWAGAGEINQPILRLKGGGWTAFGQSAGLPHDYLVGIVAAADGAIWAGYRTGVFRLAVGDRLFRRVVDAPLGQSGRLTPDKAGRIWLVGPDELLPLSGPKGSGPVRPFRLNWPANDQKRSQADISANGTLWLADKQKGLLIYPRAASGSASLRDTVSEIFRPADGLTASTINQIYEDREGSIWVATTQGLDRFRVIDILAHPELTKPADLGDVLLTAKDGAVYVGTAGGIYRISPGGEPVLFSGDIIAPRSACEAPDGRIWFFDLGQGIGFLGSSRHRVTLPDIGQAWVAGCAFDARGNLWVAALDSGILEWNGRKWARLPAVSAASELFYDRGRLLFDVDAQTIASWDGARFSNLMPADNPVGPLKHLLTFGSGFVVTGRTGLALLGGHAPHYLSYSRVPMLRRAGGMVMMPNGEAWAAAGQNIIRFPPGEFQHAQSNPTYRPHARLFGFADGLTSSLVTEAHVNMVRGGDGRLWIATDTGTVSIDPASLHRNGVPPGVAVSVLAADGLRVIDPRRVTIPAGRANISLMFSALGLAAPERLRVLYRLDGVDKDWIDPGMRREAFYTNLEPGNYRFRIIAANEDGVWNTRGDVVEINLLPTVFQTWWFATLRALAGLGVLALLYHLRTRQIAAQMRARLETQIAERERIARHLHDTLLQSVQGLILRFQAAADRMAPTDPNRERIEQALIRADGIIVEAREQVRDLRLEDAPIDLAPMIEGQIESIGFDSDMATSVTVKGQVWPLNPLVASEVYQICGEALFNAKRHARARKIEVVLEYSRSAFGLVVTDDGVGIPDEVLSHAGRLGHYGLPGMRERAQRIGGRLDFASPEGRGTVVIISISAKLAFVNFRPGWFANVLGKGRLFQPGEKRP